MENKTQQSRKHIKLIIIGCLLLLAGIGIKNCSNDPYLNEQYNHGERIKACWELHDKRSMSPSEKRLVAQVCEQKEDE